MKRFYQIFILSGFLFLAACQAIDHKNPYDLDIMYQPLEYMAVADKNDSMVMVDLEEFIPGIQLDIRYSTKNNFTGEKIYKKPKAYLRLPAAEALKKVQVELNNEGLGLKVLDAYRPYAATLTFYEVYNDTIFVAAPWKGSRHNRGCAVDVSLVDIDTGKELPMPTAFDDFSEKAAPDYMNLPDTVIKNRRILISIMKKHGFTVYPHEWWHFDFIGWENYQLMNLSFDELEKTKHKLEFFRYN